MEENTVNAEQAETVESQVQREQLDTLNRIHGTIINNELPVQIELLKELKELKKSQFTREDHYALQNQVDALSKIHFWVKFWSIFFLVGMAITGVVLLFEVC